MTPGTIDVAVFKGAKFEYEFAFFDDETGDPLDLTGLGPFVATFTQGENSFDATVTSDYDNTGLVLISVDASITKDLVLGTIHFGVRDNENNPYIESILNVKRFTPEPNLAP